MAMAVGHPRGVGRLRVVVIATIFANRIDTEHRVLFGDSFVPPVEQFATRLVAFQNLGIVGGILTRTGREVFPELDFTPTVTPTSEGFKEVTVGKLGVFHPSEVTRIADTYDRFVRIVVAGRIDMLVFRFQDILVGTGLYPINHGLGLFGS